MPFEQIPYTNFHGTNQDWMIQQIKQMIADWAAYQENMNQWRNDMDAAFNALHDYVYTYFDNLDVQQEINNKLDQMREDGVFDEILLPYFEEYTTDINNTVATQNRRINTVENQVNNFLENTGTLGTEKDPELIDVRVGADGITYATAGEAVRDQIVNLDDETTTTIDMISEKTSNLFDPTDILFGMNSTGETGNPTRALSGPMYVGADKAKIVVLNVPAGLQFQVNRYTTSDVSSYTGYDTQIAWLTAPGVHTYGYTQPYIRFLFAKTDNSNIVPDDLKGIRVQVNTGLVVQPEADYLTGKDTVARQHSTAIEETLKPYGLLPFDPESYTQGNYNSTSGAIVYASTYIISEEVEVVPGSIMICKKPGDYRIGVVCFDELHAFVKSSNYTQLYEGYKIGPTTKYVRFIIRKYIDGGFVDISTNEIRNVFTTVKYMGYSSQPTNLKVLTFNVAKWNYGRSALGIQEDVYTEKLTNYRRFFGDQGCDLVGLQEFDRLIDWARTLDARNELFNHWYKYSEISGSWEAIFSKYNISGGGTHQIWNNRYYVDTYMQFGDHVIYIMNVHLSPGHDEATQAIRAQQAQDVINLLANHEEFILVGDFNPEPGEYETLFGLFENAGYNVANAGWFGDFWTWSTRQADFDEEEPTGTTYVIDNVITSANIKINSVKKINTYKDLTSDHIPIVVELSVQ